MMSDRTVNGIDIAFATDTERVFGMKFNQLAGRQSKWSQATFGTDAERGPIGPLKHLAKEAVEAQENPGDITEFADCLLLTLDANRRAGFTPMQLVDAAMAKMEINEARKWQKPIGDEPIEHVRENPESERVR